MSRNIRPQLLILILLLMFVPVLQAEIHPISGWDLQVIKSGSGADTQWILNGFTFIDYNLPIEDIVFGVTEGGADNPADVPNIDDPDLYKMAARANDPPLQTTMFGGKSLWNDGNGDKYDFFMFEVSNSHQTESFTVQAILEDGTLGQGMGVTKPHWLPSNLDPPEPSMEDELGLVRTTGQAKAIWGIAFKITDLKDANGDPLTNLSRIQGIKTNSAGADFCLICAAKAGGPPVALNPNPVEGALETTSTVTLSWDEGNRMVSQKVYLSTDRMDVVSGSDAAVIAPAHAETSIEVQVEAGQTYYWRVDTVDDEGTVKPGIAWSFQTVPNTASQPQPYDGAKFVNMAPTLTWMTGLDSQSYTVVFGTDRDAVAGATEGTLVTEPSYTPDPLLNETVYYWRVDSFDGTTTHVGSVWQFTTARETGGLVGRYYYGEFGALILTRIDPEIDFIWDANDPNHPIAPVNAYSARWQGEVEAPADDTYTFTLTSSDWARLYVDGILVVDDWNTHGTQDRSGSIELSAGFHGIAVEFYKDDEAAEVNVQLRLWWESSLFAREIVPFGALIPEPKAIAVRPLMDAKEVSQSPRLMWMGIAQDAKHQVYLGKTADTLTSQGDVEGDTSLLLDGLDAGTLYFWRVDEVLDGQTTQGRIWQFTTAADLVIEDAENYTDRDDQAVWASWLDGYAGNGSGSLAGHALAPYAERLIVNNVYGGRQSLPLVYDNTGQFVDIENKVTGAKYSEISLDVQPQDWSNQKTLSLWYHGPFLESFTYDVETETYAVTGVGQGLGGDQDSCTFVYGQLTGDGTIIARIDPWRANQAFVNGARVGVMMRESLDADAKSLLVSLGGDAIVRHSWRTETGTPGQTNQMVQTAVFFPQYVRMVREGNALRTSFSPDGINWAEDLDADPISMSATVYVGLVVCSSDDSPLNITFADVQVVGDIDALPFTQSKILGVAEIMPEPLYVKVKDTAGGEATLTHPDADAIATTTWKSWLIDLSVLADQGLNLSTVKTLTLGVGDPAVTGEAGTVFFDDVRLLEE